MSACSSPLCRDRPRQRTSSQSTRSNRGVVRPLRICKIVYSSLLFSSSARCAFDLTNPIPLFIRHCCCKRRTVYPFRLIESRLVKMVDDHTVSFSASSFAVGELLVFVGMPRRLADTLGRPRLAKYKQHNEKVNLVHTHIIHPCLRLFSETFGRRMSSIDCRHSANWGFPGSQVWRLVRMIMMLSSPSTRKG